MRILAALLVALPLAASAQAEPIMDSGPQGGIRRSPWYIGFGLGTGDGSMTGLGNTVSFKEGHSNVWSMDVDPTNVALNFKVGATLSPNLLLGFDVTAVRSQYDNSGSSTGIQVNNYDAVVTWFPQGEGFFVRGGAGLSKLVVNIDTPSGSSSDSEDGFNILGGVGYAFWLGRTFNLTLNGDLSLQSYGSGGSLESSRIWALWVGFDWY